MIAMMKTINNDFFKGEPRVTCFTCHRGTNSPVNAPRLSLQYGEADLNFMYRLRRVFDPDGLMNPGKLLPSHPACGEGFRPSRPALPTRRSC